MSASKTATGLEAAELFLSGYFYQHDLVDDIFVNI